MCNIVMYKSCVLCCIPQFFKVIAQHVSNQIDGSVLKCREELFTYEMHSAEAFPDKDSESHPIAILNASV